MWTRDRIVKVLVAALGVFPCAASALAGGGKVRHPMQPPRLFPVGHGGGTGGYNDDMSGPPPKVPFEILVGNTR